MIQIQQVPSKVTQLPEPSRPPHVPPGPAQGLPTLLAATFQPPALAALTALLEEGTGEQLLSLWGTSSAEPACRCCFSSRHNAGDDPQAADLARGQEQARTLAGAGTLVGLSRGGREDALEPLRPEPVSRQGLWARTLALCTGAAWLPYEMATGKAHGLHK